MGKYLKAIRNWYFMCKSLDQAMKKVGPSDWSIHSNQPYQGQLFFFLGCKTCCFKGQAVEPPAEDRSFCFLNCHLAATTSNSARSAVAAEWKTKSKVLIFNHWVIKNFFSRKLDMENPPENENCFSMRFLHGRFPWNCFLAVYCRPHTILSHKYSHCS